MIAESIHFARTNNGWRSEAKVSATGTLKPESTIHFDVDHALVPPEAAGDPWLAALLVPAMFAGEGLEIQAPVSQRLARTAHEVQRVLHSWYPNLLQLVPITARSVVSSAAHDEAGPAAAFFSGGVDSWFSLLQGRDRISALITVKGFDIPYSDTTVWGDLKAANQSIARELGRELITVETNLREHVDPDGGSFQRRYQGDFWGECFHGACLAAVGLLLQQSFSSVIVPSSWQYERLQPWGSHPLLDSLWSNGRVEFVHDGAHANRLQKIQALAEHDFALRHLRVCPCYRPGVYNCGQCEKCRRTMLALRLFGALPRCPTFDRPLDLRAFELDPPKPYLYPVYREMLAQAEKGNDAELVRSLRLLVGDAWSPRRGWHRWSMRMKRSASKRWRRLSKSPRHANENP